MMAVVLLTCFVALMGAQQALAMGQKHEKKHDVKKIVEALEEQWRLAQLAGDVVTMDKMLAEDFIGISMSGQVNTKAQQLERVRTRKLVVSKVELSDMKVKLVGSIAIVTCQADVEGRTAPAEGSSIKGMYRYTRIYQHVWLRESGRLQASRRDADSAGAHAERKDERYEAAWLQRSRGRAAIRLKKLRILDEENPAGNGRVLHFKVV